MDALAFSYHDNNVYWNIEVAVDPTIFLRVDSGKFTVEEFSISPGQDPEGRNKVGDVKSFTDSKCFTFSVGRHKTGTVADFWNTRVASSQSTFGHGAGELNFAFIGSMELRFPTSLRRDAPLHTVTFQCVALAQGSSGSTNNWCFGGEKCVYQGNDTVSCIGTHDDGRTVTVYFKRGGSEKVDLVVITAVKWS